MNENQEPTEEQIEEKIEDIEKLITSYESLINELNIQIDQNPTDKYNNQKRQRINKLNNTIEEGKKSIKTLNELKRKSTFEEFVRPQKGVSIPLKEIPYDPNKYNDTPQYNDDNDDNDENENIPKSSQNIQGEGLNPEPQQNNTFSNDNNSNDKTINTSEEPIPLPSNPPNPSNPPKIKNKNKTKKNLPVKKEIEMVEFPKKTNNATRKLGFTETLTPKLNKSNQVVEIDKNTCQNIFINGSKMNAKHFYPSEFPKLTKIKPIVFTLKKGGRKKIKKRKTKKYQINSVNP
jgi:hypothetical protein